MSKQVLLKTLGTALLSLSVFGISYAGGQSSTANKALMKTHVKIIRNYEAVSHIKSDELIAMEPRDYILFDVREKDEFKVSHLRDAIWVDPSITASSFMGRYSEEIENKTVILYCSVGVRSSRLAEKLLASDTETKITQIYNLENGIFGWHNESRPLEGRTDRTDYIHPYNRLWGRMVNRRDLKRYNLDDK